MPSSVRGIDHIGITVPDIEKATLFFERAFDAQVLYHSVDAQTDNIDQPAQQHTLKLFPGTKIHAIRMLVMPHGPGIELFEMHGPEQGMPARASGFYTPAAGHTPPHCRIQTVPVNVFRPP